MPSRVRPRGRRAATFRPPSTTEPAVVPCRFPARSGILACFGPISLVSSASISWCMTRSPVAEAKARRPSLIAPATSARATVASSGRPARRAAAAGSATAMTGIFRPTVVLLLCGRLCWTPEPCQRQGLRWRTTALLQQSWGQPPRRSRLRHCGEPARNVEPCPRALSTSIQPPDWMTTPNTVERPRPVPLPSSLVAKKGSKILVDDPDRAVGPDDPVGEGVGRSLLEGETIRLVGQHEVVGMDEREERGVRSVEPPPARCP